VPCDHREKFDTQIMLLNQMAKLADRGFIGG
jgi:hypothetical protein